MSAGLSMSEADAASSAVQRSAGVLIRQAREAAGLHIGALAVSLKVPVRKIEALEADRLDELPDAVFTRALASSICRTLKVDPAPVLAALPTAAPVLLAAGESDLQASFGPSQGGGRSALMAHLSKPFVILGGALVVGALAMWLAPDRGGIEPKTPVSELATPNIQTAAPVATVASSAVPSAALPAAPEAGVAATLASASAPQPAAQASFQQAGATVEPAPSSRPGVVQFNASGTSWIEVTDAKGVVQLRKTLGQGESAQVSGDLPLRVIVGRADVTSVLVRGIPFGLPAVSRDNVARFEVK
jgi:cytoskeleton protein RodZ